MKVIDIRVPYLPPSINHAYESIKLRTPNGVVCKRKLSANGEKFKKDLKSYIITELGIGNVSISKNTAYDLYVIVYFKQLFTKKGAKSRFKRIDASNRIKIVEDAIVDTFGIDDSQFFTVVVKKETSREEGVSIRIDTHENGDARLDK